jgi:hypothetical protein
MSKRSDDPSAEQRVRMTISLSPKAAATMRQFIGDATGRERDECLEYAISELDYVVYSMIAISGGVIHEETIFVTADDIARSKAH